MGERTDIEREQRGEPTADRQEREHPLDEIAGMLGGFIVLLLAMCVVGIGLWAVWGLASGHVYTITDWALPVALLAFYAGVALMAPFGVGSLLEILPADKQPRRLRAFFCSRPSVLCGRLGAVVFLGATAVLIVPILTRWLTNN